MLLSAIRLSSGGVGEKAQSSPLQAGNEIGKQRYRVDAPKRRDQTAKLRLFCILGWKNLSTIVLKTIFDEFFKDRTKTTRTLKLGQNLKPDPHERVTLFILFISISQFEYIFILSLMFNVSINKYAIFLNSNLIQFGNVELQFSSSNKSF